MCKESFILQCKYCKELGHRVSACPRLQEKEKQLTARLEKREREREDSRSVASVSTATATTVSATSLGSADTDSKWTSKEWKEWQEWQARPRVKFLSEEESCEARKLEKKLREIGALEQKSAEGACLDVLQQKKLETKAELENHEVMRKLRMGYVRVTQK